MPSKISITNTALLLVGAEQINTFDDENREARVASAVYDVTKEAALSRHNWGFAIGQLQLAQLTNEPLFGFDHAYQLPTDPKMIRMLRKNSPQNDYRIFEDKLYTDDDEVEIIYLFDPGENDFPPYFTRALELELAKIFAVSVLQDETQANMFDQMSEREFKRARNIDSQNSPSQTLPKSEFVLNTTRTSS